MKPTQDKLGYWEEELAYIQSIVPSTPGVAYNNSRECFADYCNMQSNSADRDNCWSIAADMRQTRDIAMPDYRTNARKLGHTVKGTEVRYI